MQARNTSLLTVTNIYNMATWYNVPWNWFWRALFISFSAYVSNSFLTIAAATTTNHWKLNYIPYINETWKYIWFSCGTELSTEHTVNTTKNMFTLHILDTKTRWHIMKFGANGMKPKYFQKNFFFAHSYGVSSESINKCIYITMYIIYQIISMQCAYSPKSMPNLICESMTFGSVRFVL